MSIIEIISEEKGAEKKKAQRRNKQQVSQTEDCKRGKKG